MGNGISPCCGKRAPVRVDVSKLQLFQSTNDSAALPLLVDYIEQILCHIKKERSAENVKTGSRVPEPVKQHIGDATKLVEAISTNGEALNEDNFASKLPGELQTVITGALRNVGQLHWAAVGLSVIAFVINRIHTVSANFEKCVQLLDIMFDMSKRLHVLQQRMPDEREALNRALESIVEGVITCCCCMRQGNLFSYLLAATNDAELQKMEKVIEKLYRELGLLIAMDIQAQIPRTHYPSEYKAPVDAVGIDDRIEEVIRLLDVSSRDTGSARAVILHGFNGVGKTTLADCVMAKLVFAGFRHSRIQLYENETHMEKYQEQLYADLAREKLAFKNSEEGKQKLKEILERETTFILIDNALTTEHINNLLPAQLSLPSGSRMLLTSPRMDVMQELRSRRIDCKDYRVTELPYEAARDYVRNVVLRNQQIASAITSNRISLAKIDEVAEKCLGVPLVLRVYGQYLEMHGTDPDIYDEIARQLEQGDFNVSGEGRLGASLQYMYRRLDQNHQDAFVDICTFFQGWELEQVSLIFDKTELIALVDAALVNIDLSGKLVVNEVFRSIGIREGEKTRVRNLHEMRAASTMKKGLKGIWLLQAHDSFNLEYDQLLATKDSLRVLAVARPIQLSSEFAVSLPQLRFLHIDNLDSVPMLETPLPALRYIIWKYPKNASSVPSQSVLENIKNLKCLHKFVLQSSRLDRFPRGFKFPEFLRELDLSHSRELQELPDELGKLPKLRKLTLDSCVRLKSLPELFGQLSCLQQLDLSRCSSLKKLPESFASLSMLEVLTLTGCDSLRSFPDTVENLASLRELNIDFCKSLRELPKNFGYLSSLQSLDLKSLDTLEELPQSFGNLSKLGNLKVDSCESLSSLSESFGRLKSLKTLEVRNCPRVAKLPESFCNLAALEELYLIDLPSLRNIPERFGELRLLKELRLSGCNRLESLPDGFGRLKTLKSLHIIGCENLTSLPDGLGGLQTLEYLHVKACKNLMALPDGVGNLSTLKSIALNGCAGLKSLPSSFAKLKALKSLDFSGCESLKSLPEDFGNLENVESLNLSGCKSLQSLPKGFVNLKALKLLNLSGCRSLQSLPEGVENMQTLQAVDISGCDLLTNPLGILKTIQNHSAQGTQSSLPN